LLGLIAAPLLIVGVIARLFGAGTFVLVPGLPIAAWELSLGVWLVVKGFRPCPITAAMDAAGTLTADQDVAIYPSATRPGPQNGGPADVCAGGPHRKRRLHSEPTGRSAEPAPG
jgi:hypothetical protein